MASSGHAPVQCLRNFSFLNMKNKNDSILRCDTCQYAKNKRTVYSVNINKNNTGPFDLVHSDVWNAPVISIYGHRFFVIFIDDATWVTWVYLMKSKDEVFRIFTTYHKMVEVMFDKKIKAFRSDNGGDYNSQDFQAYLAENGIESQTSCAYTPEQNGAAERKNRHLLEVTQALLFEMNVPKHFWSDGTLTATYLINRMPSRTLGGMSPIEVLCPSKPLFQVPPKVFGCTCFVHIPKHQRDKLDPKAVKCIFVEYPSNQKGYKCYTPGKKGRVFVTMDSSFHEDVPFYSSASDELIYEE